MTVGGREVEVALAPLGVPGRRFGGEPGGEGPGMERVHVVDVKFRWLSPTPKDVKFAVSPPLVSSKPSAR